MLDMNGFEIARDKIFAANKMAHHAARQASAFLSYKYRKLEEQTHNNVVVTGLVDHFWSDLYHHALTISWRAFFCWSVLFFIGIHLGLTVGYGGMTPTGTLANAMVSVEVFIAIMINALGTGLVFARFSRPTARVLFSNKAVVSTVDDTRMLSIRIANCRRSIILSMDMEMALARLVQGEGGRYFRRFDPLPLIQAHSPLLRFTTMATHVIDERSPLKGLKLDELRKEEAEIIITITGIDEVTSQSIFARTAYTFDNILHDHHFVDIIGIAQDGRISVDFSRFHHTEEHVPAAH